MNEYPYTTRTYLELRDERDELKDKLDAALDALREWRELGDLPGGGYGGTLIQRTDAILSPEA